MIQRKHFLDQRENFMYKTVFDLLEHILPLAFDGSAVGYDASAIEEVFFVFHTITSNGPTHAQPIYNRRSRFMAL